MSSFTIHYQKQDAYYGMLKSKYLWQEQGGQNKISDQGTIWEQV